MKAMKATGSRMNAAVYAATETALLPSERGQFITRFTLVNPNWRGKPIREMVERLDHQEAHRAVIDGIFEDWGEAIGEEFGAQGSIILACAVYCAIYSYGFKAPVYGFHVYPLMTRINFALRAAVPDVALASTPQPEPATPETATAAPPPETDEVRVEEAFSRGITFGADVVRQRLERRIREVLIAGELVVRFWSQWTERQPVDMHGAITQLGTELDVLRATLAALPPSVADAPAAESTP